MFSLRNDRLCTYSICAQYWNEGKQVYQSTGPKRHVFGIKLSQLSPIFELEIPFSDNPSSGEFLEGVVATEKPKELSVMYSFNFPND